jgi:hypothetical protein
MVCSIALLPVVLIAGWGPFLAVVVLNFILFHAIWLLPLMGGRKLMPQFFQAEMRLPLILFMVAGNAGLLAYMLSASR